MKGRRFQSVLFAVICAGTTGAQDPSLVATPSGTLEAKFVSSDTDHRQRTPTYDDAFDQEQVDRRDEQDANNDLLPPLSVITIPRAIRDAASRRRTWTKRAG